MRNIIITCLFMLLTACASTAQPDPSGDWLGTLEVPGANLRVEFQIRSTESGYSASAISHDQGGQSFPAESVVFDGQAITINFPVIDGVFKGTMLDNKMEGTFSQMGLNLPFYLVRQ
jgi:uncharacterized protein